MPRSMGTCEIFGCHTKRKAAATRDFKSIIKDGNAYGPAGDAVVTMAKCIGKGFTQRLRRIQRIVDSLKHIGYDPPGYRKVCSQESLRLN